MFQLLCIARKTNPTYQAVAYKRSPKESQTFEKSVIHNLLNGNLYGKMVWYPWNNIFETTILCTILNLSLTNTRKFLQTGFTITKRYDYQQNDLILRTCFECDGEPASTMVYMESLNGKKQKRYFSRGGFYQVNSHWPEPPNSYSN